MGKRDTPLMELIKWLKERKYESEKSLLKVYSDYAENRISGRIDIL